MEPTRIIVNQIQYASAKELGRILDEYNKESFQEYEWDAISVRASYSELISMIEYAYSQCKMYLDYGNETMDVTDCRTGEQSVLNVRQALTNLKIAKDFFDNPPVVENPNKERLAFDVNKIDWDKPVYTATELKTLLGLSDSTLSRWLTGGWIPYTQVDGSDKRFIQKEHLLAFLNNPKIFYPNSK